MKIKSLFLLTVILSGTLFGQGSSQTATDYIAKRVQFTLLNPPEPVSFASASVSGNPGPATYYYWIVTQTALGASSPAGPFTVWYGPNSLSVSNFNQIAWSPVGGAISYDVLRTSNAGPPFGACNCAVATGVTGTSTNDQSNTLNAYTVNPLDPNTLTVVAQNNSGVLGFSGPVSISGLVTSLFPGNLQFGINAACGGINPGSVYMPLGLTTGVPPLTYPNNCNISCAVNRGCRLQLQNGANADFFSPANPAAANSNVTISGLVLDGNMSGQTGTSRCIYAKNLVNAHFEDNDLLNCRNFAIFVDDGSDKVWIRSNFVNTTQIGSGILVGNGPLNAVVTNFHVDENTVVNTAADGIFTTGSKTAGQTGTGPGDITGNILPFVGDTCIEVGDSSHDVTVQGNTCGLASPNRTGITARSAQHVTYTNNTVNCTTPGTTQVGMLFWNNTGDNVPFADISASNNTVTGCSGASSSGIAWTSVSNSSDSLTITGNTSVGNTTNFDPRTTNITHLFRCDNSDGICGGNGGTQPAIFDTTTAPPIFQKNGGGSLWIKDLAQSISAGGLWRILTSATNFCAINMNTAAAGDFSTNLCALQSDNNGNILVSQGGLSLAGLAGFSIGGGLGESWNEGAAVAGAAGKDVCYGDSTAHALKCSYNNDGFFNNTRTIGSATVTTAGTAVAAGTCQAQTGITITGALTSDMAQANINAALPATWQTGIRYQAEVTASNTCTVNLCNPTAASITPAATAVRCTVMR